MANMLFRWAAGALLLCNIPTVLSQASTTSTADESIVTGSTYPDGFDMSTAWGNLSPYRPAKSFDLPKGVPPGCELSQVHVLHRHAQRFATPYPLDGEGMQNFAYKVGNYSLNGSTVYTGPLSFLDDWEYQLGEDLLLENGASTEATSGSTFWRQYGRLLYRAGVGVAGWDESLNVYPNGTPRPKPVLRTTSQARILESARWWASGFFSNSAANSSADMYDLVIIPEVSSFNNTLASYESCPGTPYTGDYDAAHFVSSYSKDVISRLSTFFPDDFDLKAADILAMQNMCVYETTALYASFFCSLFTEQEWLDFEYNTDLQFYSDYYFGNPTGRAQGIGYVIELAARLNQTLIYSSDSSINYTYDDNSAEFPLDQPFYLDMSHDDIIVSVITALGLEYFKYGGDGLPVNITVPPTDRTFNLNQMTPFGARFATEIWTCPSTSSLSGGLDPVLYQNPDLSSSSASKYMRFVLNEAPVPLTGLSACAGTDIVDNGFCAVADFLAAVPDLVELAEYQFACFGNYSTDTRVSDGAPP